MIRQTPASLRLYGCIGAALITLPGAAAVACSPAKPAFHLIEANASDTSPPTSPQVQATVLRPDEGDDSGGCSKQTSPCGEGVILVLHVSASDDVSSAEQLGYLVKSIGSPAPTAGTGDTPFQARDGVVALGWGDQDPHDDLNLDVEVWAVDRAGNVSEQPTRVRVSSKGSGGGCSAFSTGIRYDWLALPVTLWLYRRRMRWSASVE